MRLGPNVRRNDAGLDLESLLPVQDFAEGDFVSSNGGFQGGVFHLKLRSVFARRACCPTFPPFFAAALSVFAGIFLPAGIPRDLWSPPLFFVAEAIQFFLMPECHFSSIKKQVEIYIDWQKGTGLHFRHVKQLADEKIIYLLLGDDLSCRSA